MTHYEEVRVKLRNKQLNEVKHAEKGKTGMT